MKPLTYQRIGTLGSDPEYFLRKEGKIVSSDQLIPEQDGIIVPGGIGGRIVRDGIQVELHPRSSYCRQEFSQALYNCLKTLRAVAKVKGMEVSTDRVITLSDEEFTGLSPEARCLGCNPSLNIYNHPPMDVNPETYRIRSTGGHIHLGVEGKYYQAWTDVDKGRLVALMDVLVGIPSVLLDRDPRVAERRELYGRAGEYRLPAWGLEYRTLSSFWTQGYLLSSLILGLARQALHFHLGSLNFGTGSYPYGWKDEWAPDFLAQFDGEVIRKAINESDDTLALQVLDRIEEWVLKVGNDTHCHALVQKEHFEALRHLHKAGIGGRTEWEDFYDYATGGKYSYSIGWEKWALEKHYQPLKEKAA